MRYRLVETGSYEEGKLITSILKGDELLRVIASYDKGEEKDGLPQWWTYIWEGKLSNQYHCGYPVEHLASKLIKDKLVTTTQKHERLVEMLLEDIMNGK